MVSAMGIVLFVAWMALSWVPALLVAQVTPRGLFFGVHVGARANPEAVRAVAGGWFRNYLFVTLAAAVAGLTRFGTLSVLVASLVAAGILIAGFVLVYFLANLQARILAVPPKTPEDAAAEDQGRSRDLFPAVATLCAVASAGVVTVYGAGVYDSLPDLVPTHFAGSGAPDAWMARTWGSVFLIPLIGLVVGGVLSLMAWLTARAGFGPGRTRAGVSPAVREHLQGSAARFLSAMAILTAVLLATIAIGSLRTALGLAHGLGPGPLVLTFGMALVGLIGAVWLSRRRFHEAGGEHYKLGLLYVNREDPAIFVPKRLGPGWTLNFGNPFSYLVLAGLLALPVIVAVVLTRSGR